MGYPFDASAKKDAGLPSTDYMHTVTVSNGGDDQAHEVIPRVHYIASLLMRWLLGRLQGGVQQQHLVYYLDEFMFRFNRCRSIARRLLFYRLTKSRTVPLFTANLLHLREGDTPC
jgi:hypothetical protein